MDCRTADDSNSSQVSERSDSESEDEAGYETDLTDPADIAGSALLLADNDHPREYCVRLADDFQETEDANEDNNPGTTLLLGNR